MNQIISFFVENFPSFHAIVIGSPIGLFWAFVCLYFAGYFKKKLKFKTGYSRKIFHFSIFFSVIIIQVTWGTSIVCLFGGMTSLVILYAIIRGPGNILYEAIARESDVPHRTYFIIIPYFATLVGGLASNILFGPLAIFGYLVTGIGDAIGEPVGTKFGRHKYRVPSLKDVKTTRSYEGSLAVFIVSLLAIISGIVLTGTFQFNLNAVFSIIVIAMICTFVEAFSPHGWDNATMQIIPPLLINFFSVSLR